MKLITFSRNVVLTLVLSLAASAWAKPPVVTPPQQDYTKLVTQRQAVDLLLEEAATTFKAPARTSNPGSTAKLPSNMEVVTEKLLKAAELEPYRADLLFSAASACVSSRNMEQALSLYRKILEIAPEDVDAHSYLAAWLRCGNDASAGEHLKKLEQINPGRAQELKRVFAVIDKVCQMPLTDGLSQEVAAAQGPTAIVTLGYVLNPDGTMHSTLIQRLEKTLELATQLPDALIVVTGGVPHNNRTEGKLMSDWLVDHGIDATRICQENYARTTVENALFSRYPLAQHRIRNAIIVSSASHVRRAQALFEIASWSTGPSTIQYHSIGAIDKPLAQLERVTEAELRGIYRDALKTMGLWSFRSYPLEER